MKKQLLYLLPLFALCLGAVSIKWFNDYPAGRPLATNDIVALQRTGPNRYVYGDLNDIKNAIGGGGGGGGAQVWTNDAGVIIPVTIADVLVQQGLTIGTNTPNHYSYASMTDRSIFSWAEKDTGETRNGFTFGNGSTIDGLEAKFDVSIAYSNGVDNAVTMIMKYDQPVTENREIRMQVDGNSSAFTTWGYGSVANATVGSTADSGYITLSGPVSCSLNPIEINLDSYYGFDCTNFLAVANPPTYVQVWKFNTVQTGSLKTNGQFSCSSTFYASNALPQIPTGAALGAGGYWTGNSNGFLVTVYSLDGSTTVMKVLAP